MRQLSLGQRMRGEVSAALLHAPPLLVLDEPTVGLIWSARSGCARSCDRSTPTTG
ncbi:MAG TPA: hypothetical protein VGH89_04525 [Pseudonocardia sp.]